MDSFTTWIAKSRRRLQGRWSAAFVSGIKPSIAPISAWLRNSIRVRTKGLKRKLLVSPKIPRTTAAAPATSPDVLPALTPARARKRRVKWGGIQPLSAATIIARVQPQWPSWATPVRALRTRYARTLLRLPFAPSTPATPVTPVAAPVSAWAAKQARRIAQTRRLLVVPKAPSTPLAPSIAPVTAWQQPRKFTQARKVRQLRQPDHASYPTTAPIPPQPVTAWQQPRKFTQSRKTRLLRTPELDSYPAAAIQAQPIAAWTKPSAKRTEAKRKLQSAAPQPSFPATPFRDITAAVLVLALRRRETRRRRRTVLHGPSYPQAPVAEQPFTAWKAVKAFRRSGWQSIRKPLEVDEHPATPPPTDIPIRSSRIVRVARGNRTVVTKRQKTIASGERD